MARRSTTPGMSVPATSAPDTLVQLDPAVILMANNARFSDTVAADEAEQMKASILEVGRIMEPVGVTVLTPPANGYTHQLRYGFRRVAGALLANESGAGVTVPAIVLHDADPVAVLREQVSENVDRKSLSLMDIATNARKMLDAGMSRQEVREVFKRPAGTKGGGLKAASNAWLNMVLGLLELPKAIQTRVHNNDLGLASAYRLMKAPADKRLAILERAEKEQEGIRETEEREEKKFEALESKIEDVTKKEAEATTALDTETAELELADKNVAEKQEAAQALYRKEQDAQAAIARAKTEDAKKKAKDLLKKATEARKAAEVSAKAAESDRQQAQRKINKAKENKEKFSKTAAELKAKLEAAREAATQPAKKAKGDGKVSPKAIEKAAKAEGVDGARKKLTGPEMRKCIEDLALVTSYPKVAAIGQAIKECFDSITTDGQMSKKLAAITGELKATSRK